jgi:hypothetical protein
MEYWNIGNIGILGIFGKLEYWNIGHIGIWKYWNIGILGYWNIGILREEHLRNIWGTLGEHLGTFKEYLKKIWGTFREHSESIWSYIPPERCYIPPEGFHWFSLILYGFLKGLSVLTLLDHRIPWATAKTAKKYTINIEPISRPTTIPREREASNAYMLAR